MITRIILGIAAISLLWGCGKEEKARLQSQVDSLRTELQASQEIAAEMQEVGVLLDSIDANRQLLRTDVVEGTTYEDYTNRLRNINNYVRETQTKIAELEKSAKKSAGYAGTIRKLRMDLEARTEQMAALEKEIENMRNENLALNRTVGERDSLLNERSSVIQMREQDIASLEAHVQEITDKAQMDQADLYFAQAEALETAADRTKFAPRKKKETQREALELYKLSQSLGKEEAQERIVELEKDLS